MNDREGLITKPNTEDTWMETFSGKYFNPLNFKSDCIDLHDIAHALSLQCRFGGHCSKFYSVAEHSVNVYIIMGRMRGSNSLNLVAALLHDAAEAYIPDIIRPIKYSIPDLKKYEDKIQKVINWYYGIDKLEVDWGLVKIADNIMLESESKVLMKSKGIDWNFAHRIGTPNGDDLIKCLTPTDAEMYFKTLLKTIGITNKE